MNGLALQKHVTNTDMEDQNDKNVSNVEENMRLRTFNDFFGGLGTLSGARCIEHRLGFVFYIIINGALGAADIYYFSFVWLSVFMGAIPFIVLSAAFYVDIISPKISKKIWYNKSRTEQNCWKMTHLETKLTPIKTYYSNAICWFFDVRNDFGIYDDRIFYLLFIIYFIMFIGSGVIHSTISLSVAEMCDSNQRGIEELNLDGLCFFAYEWTLAMNFVTFESIWFSLISSIGIEKTCVESIKNAQQKVHSIIGSKVCQYYVYNIEKLRQNNEWATTNTTKGIKYAAFWTFCLIFAFHLLWFPNDDTNAFYGPNKNVIFFIYFLCVLILFSTVWVLITTLISLVGPYQDFDIITQALGELDPTTHDTLVRKIGNWWIIRQFYHSYVLVLYYQLSNTVFAVNVMLCIIFVSIVTWWAIRATYLVDNEDVSTYSTISVIQIVIIMFLYVVIASFNIARAYTHRNIHIRMLKYHLIGASYFKLPTNKEVTDLVQLICTYITNYDVIPSIFGVTITVEKIYIFVGYIISSIVTIYGILNSVRGNVSKEGEEKCAA